jgi:hypothetical protein
MAWMRCSMGSSKQNGHPTVTRVMKKSRVEEHLVVRFRENHETDVVRDE